MVIWSADQIHSKDFNGFDGVGQSDRLHQSYGGWNQAEWSALNFMDVVAKCNPERLDAICRYPFHILDFKNGAKAMEEWLNNHGKFNILMDGHDTSVKIIFDHRK